MGATEHYQLIIRRAVEDPDVRERLVENPAGTWEEVTGTPVPEDVNLVVLEDSSRTVHIVLPDQSLTLQELDESGGSGSWSLQDSFDAKNPDMSFRCAGGFY